MLPHGVCPWAYEQLDEVAVAVVAPTYELNVSVTVLRSVCTYVVV